MKDWKSKYASYLQYEKYYSPQTVEVYMASVREFDAVCDLLNATADDIREWLMSLADSGQHAATINKKLSALRNFYRYLRQSGLIAVNPTALIEGPKKGKRLPIYAREKDMQRLLEGGDDLPQDFSDIRDRLIVEMLYSTGFRRAELLGLKDVNVDLHSRSIKVLGKRNKERIVPFGERLHRKIEEYLRQRDIALEGNAPEAFFVNKQGLAISKSKIACIVREQLSGIATLKKRTPHILRHTFATAMLNNGAEINSVKELMGHASLAATEIYTHLTFEELTRIYKNAHPRAH